MGSKMKALVLCLKFSILILAVKCDFDSLRACANQRSCWRHLDHEIIANIRDNIRNDTQPCDNFWLHACGAWQPPKGTQHVDNFGIAIEQYEKQQKELLETNFVAHDWIAATGVAGLSSTLKTYYSSCKRIETIELNRYLKELKEIESLKQLIMLHFGVGGMHASNINSNTNWLVLLAELRRFGLNDVILKERATLAFNDARKYAIELGLPAEDERFLNKNELVNYFIEFKLATGVTDQLLELAAEIFDLETQLKALTAKHIDDNDNNDDDATLELALSLHELKLKIPNIDWQLYFNVLLNQAHVDGALKIELNGVAYFREVATLLAQTDARIVGFYILMHLCRYLHEVRPRSKMANHHCVEHMNVVMPLGMNFVYKSARYESLKQDEKVLLSMFEKLKLQFYKYTVQNKLNLNYNEIEYLQEKADKMSLRLGNLPRSYDADYLNQYYNAANVTADDNFYHNHLALLRFRFEQQHRGFVGGNNKELDVDTFYVYDDIVQIRSAPYFVHELNLLIVPMVFMQLPFFQRTLHPLLQQSLVGFILGHEFNHAFEYEGIIMDALGNENSIGYGIRKKAKFKAGVKCLGEQTVTQSLIERMADVNGFQLAFDAYFNVVGNDDVKGNNVVDDDDNDVERIEDLMFENFNAQHLFFLNFAQFFCGQLPEPIDHDRDDVRVNVVVNNMPEFKRLFQCQVRNQARDLCQMWR